jgi:hypothetical protein
MARIWSSQGSSIPDAVCRLDGFGVEPHTPPTAVTRSRARPRPAMSWDEPEPPPARDLAELARMYEARTGRAAPTPLRGAPAERSAEIEEIAGDYVEALPDEFESEAVTKLRGPDQRPTPRLPPPRFVQPDPPAPLRLDEITGSIEPFDTPTPAPIRRDARFRPRRPAGRSIPRFGLVFAVAVVGLVGLTTVALIAATVLATS